MGEVDSGATVPVEGGQQSLLDAAGACMARWGVAKTTVADLATEAGCSRATVYRTFPGGKNEIMAAYGRRELQLFFAEASRRTTEAATLDDALVDVITTAARGLADHAGFQYMLTHEPGLVLPYLGFTDIGRLYRLAADALAADFERFVPGRAHRLVELAARITLSYTFQPSDHVDLCDAAAVRRLVETRLVPVASADLVRSVSTLESHPPAVPAPAHAVPA